jgi:hypothetical protein
MECANAQPRSNENKAPSGNRDTRALGPFESPETNKSDKAVGHAQANHSDNNFNNRRSKRDSVTFDFGKEVDTME